MCHHLHSKIMAEEKTRRDFIFVTTATVAAIGAGGLAWPMIGSFNPAADAKSGLDVDLSKLEEGQQLKVLWMNRPIFIRYRTKAEIATAQNLDVSTLIDPETDMERLRPRPDGTYDPRFLVLIGICTHFGCVPIGESGRFDGWYCPCHGAHFDTSGRTRSFPAPTNMKIPPYHYASETVITLERF